MELDLVIAPLHWAGLLTAVVCGSIIGLERQLSGKPAGIRTSCLICLGTYTFVTAGASLAGGDPTRVIGQVVTGVGFLGAGVILTREGSILGVTSAATIWILAAIGAQIGLRHHAAALVMALLTVGILTGVNVLENTFLALQRGVHRHIRYLRRRSRGDSPGE